MRKKLLIALAVFLGIITVFLIVVALQPAEYRVVRSITIDALDEEAFAHVNDLHAWHDWSPWAKLDPDAKNSFDGPEAGTGAVFHWSGNAEIGEGTMTIADSQPNKLIKINIEFVKPFAGTSTAEFTFKPTNDQTLVTWAMTGHNNFIAKAVCMFMNMDKMLGGEFEKGLANLKSVVEEDSKKDDTDDSSLEPS
jgi:hypothetical protein